MIRPTALLWVCAAVTAVLSRTSSFGLGGGGKGPMLNLNPLAARELHGHFELARPFCKAFMTLAKASWSSWPFQIAVSGVQQRLSGANNN